MPHRAITNKVRFYEDVLGQKLQLFVSSFIFQQRNLRPDHCFELIFGAIQLTELLHAGSKTSRPPPLPPSPATGK
jgi:hypothetical protein